jgi:hypothetical protein
MRSFRHRVPTTENLSMEIFELLRKGLEVDGSGGLVRLARVRLEETESNFVTCAREENLADQYERIK